ncbi:MAG: hypothetical protein ACRDI2_13510 [Chloroflexota bacterium]
MRGTRPTKPKLPVRLAGAPWRDHAVQALFGVVVWWAVYYRVSAYWGLGSGIIAATCAAWAYVAVCACAAYLLNQRGPGANRPGGSGGSGGSGGPKGPSGRWPGASP